MSRGLDKVVFIGPSLSHGEAEKHLEAIYLPPAVQGSIVSAVRQFAPRVILLVDGAFQSQPAVRHKEILWAVNAGTAVVGAASMGALRAAELHPYMQGVGLIYRWYRRFQLAPDDAVAVLHAPSTLGSFPLTVSLVDMRMTIRSARRTGLLPEVLGTVLEAAARSLNFRERTWTKLIATALPNAPGHDIEACTEILAHMEIRQKRQDALQALELLRRESYQPPSRIPGFVLTNAFIRDLAEAGIEAPIP